MFSHICPIDNKRYFGNSYKHIDIDDVWYEVYRPVILRCKNCKMVFADEDEPTLEAKIKAGI